MQVETALAHFCRNTRYLRRKYGRTPSQMALIMGVRTEDLLRLEAGFIPASVNASHVRRLAQYFAVPADSLFESME